MGELAWTLALLNSGASPEGLEIQSSTQEAVRPSARCHHLPEHCTLFLHICTRDPDKRLGRRRVSAGHILCGQFHEPAARFRNTRRKASTWLSTQPKCYQCWCKAAQVILHGCMDQHQPHSSDIHGTALRSIFQTTLPSAAISINLKRVIAASQSASGHFLRFRHLDKRLPSAPMPLPI